jgi:hypothetical protein
MAGLLGQKWGSRPALKAPVFYGLVALGGTALSLLRVNPTGLLVLVAVINGIAARSSSWSCGYRAAGASWAATSMAMPPGSSAGSA